jgi:hypothetical protein
VTDINDDQQSVTLIGVENFLKKWNIEISEFDQVLADQIKTIAVIVKGRHPNGKFHVELGEFAFTAEIKPVQTPDDYTISVFPSDVAGYRPALSAFSSYNPLGLTDPNDPDSERKPELVDLSTSNVTMISQSLAQIDLGLANTTSFGGAYFGYSMSSDPLQNKTINLDALFGATGITIGLDNLGSDVTEVSFEVTDFEDKQQSVTLIEVEGFLKKWNISVGEFDLVETEQIKTIAIYVKGRHPNGKLYVDLGDFAYIPAIEPVESGTPDVTPLPENSNGNQIIPSAFASELKPDDTADDSTVTSTVDSQTTATVNFNLKYVSSYGGAAFSYDDPNTEDVEVINLYDIFPDGITFGLDNGGTSLSEVFLEVTDFSGKRDRVRLIEIIGTEKRWSIELSKFDEVLLDQIKSLQFVVEGVSVNTVLHINWGNFEYIPGQDGGGSGF